jgi:hypothetical protein
MGGRDRITKGREEEGITTMTMTTAIFDVLASGQQPEKAKSCSHWIKNRAARGPNPRELADWLRPLTSVSSAPNSRSGLVAEGDVERLVTQARKERARRRSAGKSWNAEGHTPNYDPLTAAGATGGHRAQRPSSSQTRAGPPRLRTIGRPRRRRDGDGTSRVPEVVFNRRQIERHQENRSPSTLPGDDTASSEEADAILRGSRPTGRQWPTLWPNG